MISMTKKATTMTLNEFYQQYGEKVFEAVLRQKNGTYKAFSKIILQDPNKEITDTINKSLSNLNNVAKNLNSVSVDVTKHLQLSNVLSTVGTITSVVNLCTTIAGFAIVCNELNKIEDSINDLAKTVLKAHEQETLFKFDVVFEDYKDMLDRKKIKKEYSEKEYINLIKYEQSILKLLIRVFNNSTCNDKSSVLSMIMALSSMFACTISNFDEVYYFNNKEYQKWHGSHEEWVNIYDTLLSESFRNSVQDYMFIEKGYNQYDTDLFVLTVSDSFKEAKQAIKDKQTLIELQDTKDKYNELMNIIKQSTMNEINNTFEGLGLKDNLDVMNCVQETAKTLELYS